MKLDIFGKKNLEVIFRGGEWIAYYYGAEGKKRLADDIRIPPNLSEDEVIDYVADVFHEYANVDHNKVTVIG